MLVAAAATIGVPHASSPVKKIPHVEKLPLLKIYCCYCVCAADARSVSNS